MHVKSIIRERGVFYKQNIEAVYEDLFRFIQLKPEIAVQELNHAIKLYYNPFLVYCVLRVNLK